MTPRIVGKAVPRVDALAKVTGQAVYATDVRLPGMLYGCALRSPLAHAKILEVDVSAARKVPGVRAVVTGKDFPYTFGHMIQDQPFLHQQDIRPAFHQFDDQIAHAFCMFDMQRQHPLPGGLRYASNNATIDIAPHQQP